MSEEKSYARFFSYLNLFTASMLILMLGSNLPLMFVGWEGVGLCSYLLIGFWWENPAYAAAGRKAFVANRIGDFGVLIGMFILVERRGSFEFADINARRPASSTAAARARRAVDVRHAQRSRRRRRCSCSSAAPARARRSRCTCGCPTRWPARRRSAR